MNISTAYDAFWFLMEHPKMRCREAMIVARNFDKANLCKGERLRVVKDEMPWLKKAEYTLREVRLYRHALQCNLDIHWTKVDARGTVNRDDSKNVRTMCVLECGSIKNAVSDGHLHMLHYHDIRLDCWGATFDKAIVKLARLVKKHYGDFKKPKWA